MKPSPLQLVFDRSDEQFFKDHPDRQARIRKAFDTECQGEFWSLGPHEKNRRRIILWRVPKDNPHLPPATETIGKVPLLKIPFLAFADETIEDNDATLLPMIDGIMGEAAARMS